MPDSSSSLLFQNKEENRQLAALNCLFMISKHHSKLEDTLTAAVKLHLWNKLIIFLQILLNKQLSYLGETRNKTEYVKNLPDVKVPDHLSHDFKVNQSDGGIQKQLSHALRTDQSDDGNKHYGKKRDSVCPQEGNVFMASGKNISTVQDVLKLLEKSERKSLNCEQFSPSYLTTVTEPMQCWSSSDSASKESILSPAAINTMYRTSVFEGTWERNSSDIILLQVQSVIASVVMSFDLEDFTNVIQGIVEDVVSNKYVCNSCCQLMIFARSEQTSCQAESGSKLFDHVINYIELL